MRIKVIGQIIEKTKPLKQNYKHELYSMFINNLDIELAETLHSKMRFYRLFTFSNVYIHDNKQLHFYIAGEDTLIKNFVNHILFNQMIRIDDMVVNITNIEPCSQLNKQEMYNFKSNIIVNINKDNKCILSDDMSYIEKRIVEIAQNKAKELKINNTNFECKISNPVKQYNKYKNHHIENWKCKIELKGDYEIINMLYNIGMGENTSSGHGMLFQIR